MGLTLPVREHKEQRWPVRKSEDPYTGVNLPARSVTNWSRPPTRRTCRIFSDGPVGRAALIVDPIPTANANDRPAVEPTPTTR